MENMEIGKTNLFQLCFPNVSMKRDIFVFGVYNAAERLVNPDHLRKRNGAYLAKVNTKRRA